MCRMLAYLGAPIGLGELIEAPPHSLLLQSYKARELEGAVVNADGWGAGWTVDGDERPCLYRSTLPIWADANREHLGRAIVSRNLLAAVRSATDPLSISMANTQPFASGPLTFLHNGYVERFTMTLERAIRERLSARRHAELRGNTDSEHVFALLADAWDAGAELDAETRLIDAAKNTVSTLRELAKAHGTKALMAAIVSDGRHMVAVRVAFDANAPSLYLRCGWHGDADARVIASEPLDDVSAWERVEPGELIALTAGVTPRRILLS